MNLIFDSTARNLGRTAEHTALTTGLVRLKTARGDSLYCTEWCGCGLAEAIGRSDKRIPGANANAGGKSYEPRR